MNVYDFDGTIYDGDSSVDFILFCFRRHPRVFRRFPSILGNAFLLLLKRIDKTAFKEQAFSFLRDVDACECVASFWENHLQKIKPWYLASKTPDDVVVSASPEFLLAPACHSLQIMPPIGSRISAKDGKFEGINCHGEEKVKRFFYVYPDASIDSFFSDRLSDAPLARKAKRSVLVKGDRLLEWKA